VVDAPVDFDVTIKHDLQGATDFKIIGHRLEFIGICPECST
jgi:Fe2+ or Zn2+ uptake regulation protein